MNAVERHLLGFAVSLVGHAVVVAGVVYFGRTPTPLRTATLSSVQERIPSALATLFTVQHEEKPSLVVYYEGKHVQGAMFLSRADAAEVMRKQSTDDEDVGVEVYGPAHPLYERLARLIQRGAEDEKIEAVLLASKKAPVPSTFDTRFSMIASLKK